jgi:hypothetical protein
VLFTDGVDTASQVATYEGTLRFAQELDSLIYPIQYDTLEDLRKQAVEMNAQIVTAKGESLSVAYVVVLFGSLSLWECIDRRHG